MSARPDSHQLLCTGNILKNFRTHDDTNCYKSGSGVSFKSDIIIIKHKRVKYHVANYVLSPLPFVILPSIFQMAIIYQCTDIAERQ